jgi:dihydrofolate reductase
MTKTQYYTATTIDGFIAGEGNDLDWLMQFNASPDNEGRFAKFFGEIGAVAMGANTYQWILDHEQALAEPGKWRDWYGDTPCWVFAHRDLQPVPGANLRFVQGSVDVVHAAMVPAAGGGTIWLVGGGELAGQFADKGLLDEIQLGVAPVTLGAGAPLLPRRLTTGLRLAEVEHGADFVFLTYRVEPQRA